MNTKNDPTDAADRLEENVMYLRTVLLAAEDKLQFCFSNKKLLGPHWELLSLYTAELGNLLGLAEQFLERMEGDIETVTGILFDRPCEVE